MFLLTRIRNLPGPLIFMVLVFFATPFISLFYLPSPLGLFQKYTIWEAVLLLTTYWVLPFVVVGTIIGQSFTALIFLTLEAFCLIVTSILNLEMLVSDVRVVRFVSISLMAFLGWLVINQDLLFPFLTDNHRFWRRYRRIYGNRVMTMMGNNQNRFRVMLNDVSLTGMGVTVPREAGAYMAALKVGDELEFEIKERELSCVIKAKLVWKKSLGPVMQVGVEVNDKPLMEKVQSTIKYLAQAPGWQTTANKLWAMTHVRQFIYVLWAAAVIVTFCMPIYSTLFSEQPPEARFSASE